MVLQEMVAVEAQMDNTSANDRNSGGGGGGNGGFGGMGGDAWNTAVASGGFGGAPFPGSAPRLSWAVAVVPHNQ